MLGSGFRRALSRFGSSSDHLDQPTDDPIRKDKQKAAPPEYFISEGGVIHPATLVSNPWRERTLSSRGKQAPALDPQLEKHLPRVPVLSNEDSSVTGLFESIPHLNSTIANSVRVNVEPVIGDSDKASSGLLLDKLATGSSAAKHDPISNSDEPLEDRRTTNPKRTFLDRRLVALSLAERSISSNTTESLDQPESTDEASDTIGQKIVFDSFSPESVPQEITEGQSLPDHHQSKPAPPKQNPDTPETGPSRAQASKTSFSSFLHKLATVPVTQPTSVDSSSLSQRAVTQDHPLSTNSTFPRATHDLDTSSVNESGESTTTSTSRSTSSPPLPFPQDDDDQEKKRKRKRPPNTFLMLQPIVESGDNLSPPTVKPSSSGFTPSTLGVDSSFAKRMEETGRLRRLQSQQSITSNGGGLKPLLLSPKASPSLLPPEKPSLNGSAHSKAHSEGDLLKSRPAIESSLPPSFKNDEAKVNEFGNSDDQAALHDFLERTLRELEEAQREAARIKAQSNLDKLRFEEQTKDATGEVLALQKENQLQKTEISNLEKQLKDKERDVLRLSAEKQDLQEQLDTMHHRLSQAERQIRCLDHLTSTRLEARTEGIYGPTRRARLASPSKEPSVEVIGALGALNEEILQTANLLVENLERAKSVYPTSEDATLAKMTLGNKVTKMIQAQANDNSKGFRFLLMQVVLEVFMVHWCTNIIEGWYPKHQSFADLLIEMNSKTVTSSAPRVDCGKVKLIQTSTTTTVTMRFPEWAADILLNLGKILQVAGLRMRPNRASLFTTKLISLVKMAYDVRTALAEKDICGNLDLSVVGPDMPFQPKWMEEAHAMTRHQLGTTMQMEYIVGTCGMGLKRTDANKVDSSLHEPAIVLKPRVVLTRVLDASP